MVVFIGRQQHAIFGIDDAGTPTKLYIYASGISTGELNEQIGWKNKDGTLIDGSITNWMQACAAGYDVATLTSATIEVDADSNSPREGQIRLVLPLS